MKKYSPYSPDFLNVTSDEREEKDSLAVSYSHVCKILALSDVFSSMIRMS